MRGFNTKGTSMKSFNKEFQRRWKGLPLHDATDVLRLVVTTDDIATATQGAPGCCALANCCSRSFQSGAVAFYRQKAFVELPDGEGGLRVERYDLHPRTRDFIVAFDEGLPVAAGMYFLRPPRPSHRLDNEVRAKRAEKARAARAAGEPTPRRKPAKSNRPKKVADFLRDGRGQVKFTKGTAVGKPRTK
jgi:hypothetical protein